jgi:hypothetical protein
MVKGRQHVGIPVRSRRGIAPCQHAPSGTASPVMRRQGHGVDRRYALSAIPVLLPLLAVVLLQTQRHNFCHKAVILV